MSRIRGYIGRQLAQAQQAAFEDLIRKRCDAIVHLAAQGHDRVQHSDAFHGHIPSPRRWQQPVGVFTPARFHVLRRGIPNSSRWEKLLILTQRRVSELWPAGSTPNPDLRRSPASPLLGNAKLTERSSRIADARLSGCMRAGIRRIEPVTLAGCHIASRRQRQSVPDPRALGRWLTPVDRCTQISVFPSSWWTRCTSSPEATARRTTTGASPRPQLS